jgi:hypothetical protein
MGINAQRSRQASSGAISSFLFCGTHGVSDIHRQE